MGGGAVSFFTALERRCAQIGSLLCVGLDPHHRDLPQPTAQAARSFCLRLIEATADLAAAYKPNAAFFEAFGAEGWTVLQEVIAAVPEGIAVILDAKRGDIASTAEAYAKSAFETLGADAITINAYMGYDSLEPFLRDAAKGVFLVCKTSNPGAVDFQDLWVCSPDGRPLRVCEEIALMGQEWNTQNNLGLVVGATQVESLARIRGLARGLWFLAPGVGAQGADLAAALHAGMRDDGFGMLIPVSRGISRAADPRQAALDLVNQIRELSQEILKQPRRIPLTPDRRKEIKAAYLPRLAEGLLHNGCIQFGDFTLKSGIQSPIYIDLRRLVRFPQFLADIADAYIALLKELRFDHIAALPYAAIPIGTAICLRAGWSMVYPRKESKSYGTKAEVEGVFQSGQEVVIIDDLITTGGSKFEGIEKLVTAGLVVNDIIVLIDRQSGAREALETAGFRLHAVLTLTELLDFYEEHHLIPIEKINETRTFLENTRKPNQP